MDNFHKFLAGMIALLIGVLAIMGWLASGAKAESVSWPIVEMNRVIDQTNFIVDAKCSGTLISVTQRLILTNNHCVEAQIKIVEEEVTNEEGEISKVKREKFTDVPVVQNHYKGFAPVGSSAFQTEIVAHDKIRDLAILRFRQDSIPMTVAATMLPDGVDLVRGQPTVTVGNPALMEATIVTGEISSLTRQIEIGGTKRDYIQVSGGLTGGNSGGALYDGAGRLIGVPAAGRRDASFIGLAIPIMSVKEFLKQHCLESVFRPMADDAKCKADKEAKDKK